LPKQILQNKVDLTKQEAAEAQAEQIKRFTAGDWK
jgi:translation initiation factor 2 gamma subunit (eIF-2gamma)